MGIFEGFVVFVGAWWIIFLPTLSAGTRSQHEAGNPVRGSEHGAPESIRWKPKLLIATGGAAVVTFLLWLSLHFHVLDFLIPTV